MMAWMMMLMVVDDSDNDASHGEGNNYYDVGCSPFVHFQLSSLLISFNDVWDDVNDNFDDGSGL